MTLSEEVQALKETVSYLQEGLTSVQAQMLAFRSKLVEADPEAVEELLAYIASEFKQDPWVVSDVWSQSCASPFLQGAIRRCLGKHATDRKLSHFCGKAIGIWGGFKLECVNDHSRNGRLYCVTKLVISSQIPGGIVEHHNRRRIP